MSPAKKNNSSPEGVLACDNDLIFTFVTTGCLPTAVVHMYTRGRIHVHKDDKNSSDTMATSSRMVDPPSRHQTALLNSPPTMYHRAKPRFHQTVNDSKHLVFLWRAVLFHYFGPHTGSTCRLSFSKGIGASSFPLYSLMFTPKTPSGDPIPYCDYR